MKNKTWHTLDERERSIREALQSADRAREEAQVQQAEHEKRLAEAETQARQIVVKLLEGRLTFESETRAGLRGLRLHAVGTVAKLVSGVVPSTLSCLQVVASPRGTARVVHVLLPRAA